MAQVLKLPERFLAYCNSCEWEGEMVSANLPQDDIVKCPKCGENVLAGTRPTLHAPDAAKSAAELS
ncbi:hypothetical protein FBQ81_03340 [Chloroflexi bacterium CFX6]|nr:hypothetical protein [Chloroflexi bacterium CFX6]